ncbi:axoneme-associated protein mst101(2)-like [Trichogramma pretiosum]|uniref:axoneme-associated protein mst101(2)-like n=1 Tax=Trichogramma pretiosum TaxID=7493 RepID=UPI0006C96F15|nr:axoneme-associated protein mst101(2)-like [Trichogramma pretiosum]
MPPVAKSVGAAAAVEQEAKNDVPLNPSGKIRKAAPDTSSQRVKLRNWLKTSEDWARFRAWAKINAKPKKCPEPEPIIRPAVPITQLKPRIVSLARPRKGPNQHCIARAIAQAALKAKASRRLKWLAVPRIKISKGCKKLGGVKPKALEYEPTERILDLSKPKLRPSEGCREEVERCYDDEAPPLSEWMEFLALPDYRKLMCQDSDCAAEMKQKILDALKNHGRQALKEQRKRRAEERRKAEELRRKLEEEARLKAEAEAQAAGGASKKAGNRCEDKSKDQKPKCVGVEEMQSPDAGAGGGGLCSRNQDGAMTCSRKEPVCEKKTMNPKPKEAGAAADPTCPLVRNEAGEKAEKCKEMKRRLMESAEQQQAAQGDEIGAACDRLGAGKGGKGGANGEDGSGGKKECLNLKWKKKIKSLPDPPVIDEEYREKRFWEKNAWRFEDTCKMCTEFPRTISKAALAYQATEDINRMAQPKEYPDSDCRDPYKIKEAALKACSTPDIERMARPKEYPAADCRDPYTIPESALNAPTTPLYERLAIPKYQCEPVERYPPPRETDEYGRYLFPKPCYGRNLPPRRPLPPEPCPKCWRKKDQEEAERRENEENDEADAAAADAASTAPSKKGAKGAAEAQAEAPADDEAASSKSQECKKEKKTVCKPIAKIAFENTIDPALDPIGAKRQRLERKRWKELVEEEKKRKEAETRAAKEAEMAAEEQPDGAAKDDAKDAKEEKAGKNAKDDKSKKDEKEPKGGKDDKASKKEKKD